MAIARAVRKKQQRSAEIVLYRAEIILHWVKIILYRVEIVLHHPEIVLHHPEIILHHPEIILHHPEIVLHHPEIVLHHPEIVPYQVQYDFFGGRNHFCTLSLPFDRPPISHSPPILLFSVVDRFADRLPYRRSRSCSSVSSIAVTLLYKTLH